MKTTYFQSWLGVYRKRCLHSEPRSLAELQEVIDEGFVPIGASHSYNGVQLKDKVVSIPQVTQPYLDGEVIRDIPASYTVEQVMQFALSKGRKLINSGNFRKQTIAGVVMTGTHGFGPDATIADAVDRFTCLVNGKLVSTDQLKSRFCTIVALDLHTDPLRSYDVYNCVCVLSGIGHPKDSRRAYAVFPYSNSKDPQCFVTDYYDSPDFGERPEESKDKQWRWSLLKLFWLLDGRHPIIRKIFQKGLNFLHFRKFMMRTSKWDLDAMYHPWPTLDKVPKFSLWAFKPTYTCHNVALFSKPEDTYFVIKEAISQARKIHPSLFRCFIGVRQLSTKSDIPWAGNYDGPRDAIDFYCDPKLHNEMHQLQEYLQAMFDLRPHLGKTGVSTLS